MIRRLALGLVTTVAVAGSPLWAAKGEGGVTTVPELGSGTVTGPTPTAPATAEQLTTTPVRSELGLAIQGRIAALDVGASDEDHAERSAIASFYEARNYAGIWVSASGVPTAPAVAAAAELQRAGAWGLDPHDFAVPRPFAAADTTTALAPEAAADAEVGLTLAVLKYGRFARGGRIINPAEQLSSYLDRRPQLKKPALILDEIAAAAEADAYLRGLHPQHPQFERLRQKYLALPKGRGNGGNVDARRILANMEQWRWMPADMGDLYVWNNLPEFTQRVVKNNEVVLVERIVAGEIGKQTPVFSRPMRRITFKPTWKVPDSIKAREIWPSLLRGGGLMRQWDLELRTKDGQLVDWRKIDWTRTNILEYDVLQPNGPKSVMGKVKFSFPNQHTVFMHDTLPRDKYMFNVARRTFSHGCMRVRNPHRLAEVLMHEEQGWDAAKVQEAFTSGPLNNEIALQRKIIVHTTYFTAMVDDDGKLQTFPDMYGHERRISQALDGKWDRIAKGRDHLAPVEVNLAKAQGVGAEDRVDGLPGGRPGRAAKKQGGGFMETIFGIGYN